MSKEIKVFARRAAFIVELVVAVVLSTL